ncbi:MAG: ribosome biogenesis factor YjgA [Desulfobacterales bacterium]|nr:ribosome biogenesis factor YjgA [Desulfobacterales bacterium]MDD4073824.1 ribosome biogenesis factor YjgA [Desulfobacterales bacterium]MDD4392320.1 ribosome biogenesis factor YjgA [Desulfobacterales bacterium]
MEEKSKSQIKREMTGLQKLGEQLVELSAAQIDKLELSDELREAVLFAKNVTQNIARRRQLQYIGTLMRQIDPEPIYQFFRETSLSQQKGMAEFHQIETWRNELVEGNDTLLEDIIRRFPEADLQYLRQLVRNARNVKHTRKASRDLFRYLKTLMESRPEPTEDEPIVP